MFHLEDSPGADMPLPISDVALSGGLPVPLAVAAAAGVTAGV